MAQKYPEHIQKNVDRDKNYYSLYNMENIERCKADPDYLGEAILMMQAFGEYARLNVIGG